MNGRLVLPGSGTCRGLLLLLGVPACRRRCRRRGRSPRRGLLAAQCHGLPDEVEQVGDAVAYGDCLLHGGWWGW